MNYVKMLGFAALTAVVSMAFTGMASASVFRSGSEGPYTKAIVASSGNFEIHGEAFSVSCSTASFGANVTKHGSVTDAGGALYTLDFNTCSFPVTVTNVGSFDVDNGSGGNGDFDLFNTSITVHGPFGINCLYQADSALFGGTGVGSFTGSNTGHAVFDWSGGLLPRTGDSGFCGGEGELTGSFTVVTPNPLTVE